MNIYHLQYFLESARAGNLGEAARIHRVTHSTISQAIKSLEQELGVSLLRHAKRRFELTDEGRFLVVRGKTLVDELSRMKTDLLVSTKEP